MALSVTIQKKLGSFALNVSFEVKNEILALLGASGSGKSMTLKCIAGIETPDTGRIVLNDRVLFDSDAKINLPPQKRHVGYMFQDYALFPHMTVTKNIMAGMGKRPDEKVVRDYLKRFQLEGLEERIPAQLSGGQKQRVAMARMLAAQPEVILLDEPFSALDSYLRWELESEMKKCLKAVKKPVLFVSHDRDEVFRLCDTVCCIDRGHAHPAETVREFFENPKTRAAARLSGCKNFSRVRRLDEHHLEALDWKVVLQVQREIPADVKGVGIRAHSFQAGRGENFDNHFPVTEPVVQEDLFEWNVAFKPSADSSYLQWKFEKNDTNAKEMKIPSFLSVSSNRILLLSDDGTDGWE